jgi:hypothetical protein
MWGFTAILLHTDQDWQRRANAFVRTPMIRYFFDLHNDVDAIDEEGVELPDLEAAKAHSLGEARTMIQASVADAGRIDLRHHIDVRDESGAVVHVMRFEDAVKIQRGEHILSQPPELQAV